MKYTTSYRLEDFILNTRWEDVPVHVRERMKGCFVDLMGALLVGSKSEQFRVGIRLAERLFPAGNVPAVGTDKTFGVVGAASVMGHSSNAYDIDDGHNIIRAHPGTSFVGGVLAQAWESDIKRDDFLAAMLVSYETTVRSGKAVMDYYKFAHSSGTFGAVGVAAGVGRIRGYSRERLNNALSVAEFNAPLVPGIRSVEYPSMNKDGVPFGVMIGMLALEDAECGFTGNKNLLESDEYSTYLDDLGENWEVMQLYFKPYTCCRWAHPAIDACLSVMRENSLSYKDVKSVSVYTFERATRLSKIVPKSADEAQYNIAYPVAAAIVCGDFGYAQVEEKCLGDARIAEMMKRLSFHTDEKLDALFPEKRMCRASIETFSGERFDSPVFEPRGEAKDNVDNTWLCEKFRRITSPVITPQGQERLIDLICGDENVRVRSIVAAANSYTLRKKQK